MLRRPYLQAALPQKVLVVGFSSSKLARATFVSLSSNFLDVPEA